MKTHDEQTQQQQQRQSPHQSSQSQTSPTLEKCLRCSRNYQMNGLITSFGYCHDCCLLINGNVAANLVRPLR